MSKRAVVLATAMAPTSGVARFLIAATASALSGPRARPVAMREPADTQDVGVFATSHDPGVLGQAQFSNFAIS